MGLSRRFAIILLLVICVGDLAGAVVPGVIASGPYLSSITAAGLSGTCTNGLTYPVTATGYYSQSATRNLTTTASWSCNANCSVVSSGNITITGSP